MDKTELGSKKVVVKNLQELESFAGEFLLGLGKRDDKKVTRATIVTLHGDLGSGKTAFVKECAKLLGVNENVTSPTFVILKKYSLPEAGPGSGGAKFTNLIHIDAYRLSSIKDLTTIGWDKVVDDPHNLIMIEWPERVFKVFEGELISPGVVRIEIEHNEDGSRVFHL